MLNREDVRKVLEARAIVVNRLKDEDKNIEDVPMKTLHEFILEEMKKREETKK